MVSPALSSYRGCPGVRRLRADPAVDALPVGGVRDGRTLDQVYQDLAQRDRSARRPADIVPRSRPATSVRASISICQAARARSTTCGSPRLREVGVLRGTQSRGRFPRITRRVSCAPPQRDVVPSRAGTALTAARGSATGQRSTRRISSLGSVQAWRYWTRVSLANRRSFSLAVIVGGSTACRRRP